MSGDVKYYLAGGRSLEAWDEYRQSYADFVIEAIALRDEVGASGVNVGRIIGGGYRIVSFAFEGEPPTGWRQVKGGGWLPKRNSKARKELSDRIQELRQKNADLDYEMGYRTGQIVSSSIETLDGKVVIGVPLNDKGEPFYEPFDATPLKNSEYWALKEAGE